MPADWRPSAELSALRARAALLARVRAFFAERGVLEVETPVLSRFASTDSALESLETRYQGPGAPAGQSLWLHTSPEFAMKRLLAAGAGPIYQVCKVFRDGEYGRLHNPEFSLLEWYRPGFDADRLMDEVAELVAGLLGGDWPRQSFSYLELFQHQLGVDPHRASGDQLAAIARQAGLSLPKADVLDRQGWLDLLLTHLIEPQLGRGCLTFVYDYPASQCSLARLAHRGELLVAERFELYLQGVEIANGFHELTDPGEQRQRFEADNASRLGRGQREMPLDLSLLAALESGLPDCSGVALGIDRLLMVMTQADSLARVLAFPLERA